jgi:hypothetical protein
MVKFSHMAVVVGKRRAAERGRFGARVDGRRLIVPSEFGSLKGRIPGAEELVDLVRTYPTDVANAFGWTLDEVAAARDELLEVLRGHVDEALLAHVPRKRSFGSIRPSGLRLRADSSPPASEQSRVTGPMSPTSDARVSGSRRR